MDEHFSTREGYQLPATQTMIRECAPEKLREAILAIVQDVGMHPFDMLDAIRTVLLRKYDPTDYNPIFGIRDAVKVAYEVKDIMMSAQWYEVYNIIEAFYKKLTDYKSSSYKDEFERRLNDELIKNGVGWELCHGQITHRGSEAFDKIAREVPDHLKRSGYEHAADQMREALKSISRRPKPEATGAVMHAMGALEAVTCEITGQSKPDFGRHLHKLNLPKPLDQAVDKLWGFSSGHARHMSEKKTVDPVEAELVVTVAGALCTFLTQRNS